MKAVVIHAVHWNKRNYVGAGGIPGGSGYVKQSGYGHEEWNNNAKWHWNDHATGVPQRLFFTNANSKKLDKFLAEGNELAIAMVATHDGQKDLVGIACDVVTVEEERRSELARVSRLRREYERVWDDAPDLRQFFNENRGRFERQIRGDQDFFRWSAPAKYFKWFRPPITIGSEDLLENDQITHQFGGSQGIEPDALIRVLKVHLPAKSPILDWLGSGDFSDEFISKRERPNSERKRVATEEIGPLAEGLKFAA